MFDKLETLDDLLEMQLKDLYSAETQLVKALPLMAAKAKDGRLRAGFTKHLHETERQVERLEKIGEALNIDLTGHTQAANLLLQTLDEEQLTDTKLNDLAKNYLNAKAL
jgi:ferritin-like metal-binding protein YciE